MLQLHVRSGLRVGPRAGLDLNTPGNAVCADRGNRLQAVICAYSCIPAFFSRMALGQTCTGRTSDTAPSLLRFHPSQLAAKGAGAGKRQQKEMGGDGECREVQAPSSQGENLVQRTLRIRPICTCVIDVTLMCVQGLHHTYIDVSLQQKQPGSGQAVCLGLQRALCHRRVLQVLFEAVPDHCIG